MVANNRRDFGIDLEFLLIVTSTSEGKDLLSQLTMKRTRTEAKAFRGKNARIDDFKSFGSSCCSSSGYLGSSNQSRNFSSLAEPYLGTVIATSSAVGPSPLSSKDTTPVNAYRDALKSATAGAMAAIFSRTLTAPIDRVKLVLQLQRISPVTNSSRSNDVPTARHHRSAWKVCRQIYSTEGGLRAFWRGPCRKARNIDQSRRPRALL